MGKMGNIEEIVACAFKDKKDGKIYLSRMCHAEIIGMFWRFNDKEIGHRCEQGFITNFDRFVDRKEALKIAKNAGQKLHKYCLTDELYSEDIFYDLFEEDKLKKKENIINEMVSYITEQITFAQKYNKRKECSWTFPVECHKDIECKDCVRQKLEKKVSVENGNNRKN